MTVDIIDDDDKIKGVIKENKCPYCNAKKVINEMGGTGSGLIRPGGKYPKIQFINFRCRNCSRTFDISKFLCDKFR